jgi:hypothetical protein
MANPPRTTAAQVVKVRGYVWCDRHGEVHEDTLNPYEWPASERDVHWCRQDEHEPVYRRRKR